MQFQLIMIPDPTCVLHVQSYIYRVGQEWGWYRGLSPQIKIITVTINLTTFLSGHPIYNYIKNYIAEIQVQNRKAL